MRKTHIIIGASAAAIGAINRLTRLCPDDQIVCISAQQELPYNTCFLVDHLAGNKTLDQVHIGMPDNPNLTILLNTRLTAIAPAAKQITLSDGQTLAYDTLLLAMGVSPVVPTFEFMDELTGIFIFHTLMDTQKIQAYVDDNYVKRVIVMGAGFTGLECADALSKLGLEVTVIDMAPHVLPHHLDSAGAEFVQQCMVACGVTAHMNDKVVGLLENNKRFAGVVLASGQEIAADMLVCAIGARPNSQIAAQAGIALHGNGIATNEYMQTNYPDIYAAGDVAAVKNQLDGSLIQSCMWADAMLQGMMAACAMSGQPRVYPGMVLISTSEFFGVKIAACGLKVGTPGTQAVRDLAPYLDDPDGYFTADNRAGLHTPGEPEPTGIEGYQQFVLDVAGRLKGFVLIGNLDCYVAAKRALLTQTPLDKGFLAQ